MRKYFIIIIVSFNQIVCYSQTPSVHREQDISEQHSLICSENYFSLTHLVIFTLAMLLGIVLTFLFSKNKIDQFKANKRILEKRIKSLEQELLSKKNKLPFINFRDKTVENIETDITELVNEEISQPIELQFENKVKLIAEPKVLYFPNPNLDGNFRYNDGKETFIEGTSVYKFTLKDELNADVEFCDHISSVTIALNNRNEMILSLAIETNPYSSNAMKITTIESQKAKAQLENNIWVIKEKAKIKYV